MFEIILKINLSIAIIFIVYKLFLAKSKQLHTNRFYLLLGLLIAIAFPIGAKYFSSTAEAISANLPTINFSPTEEAKSYTENTNYWLIFYSIGVLFMLTYFLFGMAKIVKFIFNSQKETIDGNSIFQTEEPNISFNFLNFIFISKDTQPELKSIIMRHELVHKNQLHSIDILLVEILKIAFWFNPILWFYKNSMVENHEFLADSNASKENPKKYQNWLIKTFANNYSPLLVNQFFTKSLIKNRIKMLHKKPTFKSKFGVIVALPLMLISLTIISCTGTSLEPKQALADAEVAIENKKVSGAEKLPQFPGGMDGLIAFFQENITYPEALKSDSIEGKAFIKFNVSETGELSNFEVVKSDHELFSKAGLEIAQAMPSWEPAESNGKKVAMNMTLPIAFSLK
jgi:TonB family protein